MSRHIEVGIDGSVFECSECRWTYPLKKLRDVADYLQKREAKIEFARHDCVNFIFNEKRA